MLEYSNGTDKDLPGLWDQVAQATREVVQRQVDLGIDIVSDGEYGKASYAGYVKERLTGFDGEPRSAARNALEQSEFPDWVRSTSRRASATRPTTDPSAAGSRRRAPRHRQLQGRARRSSTSARRIHDALPRRA